MLGIGTLNDWSVAWSAFMLRSLVEATSLLAVLLLVWFPLRRRMSSQLAHGLFLLVLVKAAVPLPIPLPASLAWLAPQRAVEPPRPFPKSSPVTPARSSAFATIVDDRSTTPGREFLDRPNPIEATSVPIVADLGRRPSRPVPSPRRSSPPRPVLSARAILMLGWAALVVSLAFRFAWAQARMAARLRDARPIDPASLPIDFLRLQRLCGLRRRVPLIVTPMVVAPAVSGLFRPRVLIPPGLMDALTPGQLTWALLHELVHVRRGDLWVVLFQRLAQIVYVFHPAVWVANRLIDVQREFACDDAALALTVGVPRHDCGAGFLAIIERAHTGPDALITGLGLFGSQTFLRRRLMRILDSRRPLDRRLSTRAALLLAVSALIALPSVRAQKPSEAPKPEAAKPVLEAAVKSPESWTIDLRVVGEDGKPIVGARVQVYVLRQDFETRTHATDNDGRCRVVESAERTGFIDLGVYKEGYVPVSVGFPSADFQAEKVIPYTLTLHRGQTIGGIVRDERGLPIVGAKVVPWFLAKERIKGRERFFTTGDDEGITQTTDAQGRWKADILPAEVGPKDKLLFRLAHPDFASDRAAFSRSVPIEEARAGTGVLVMKDGVSIVGRVFDPQNQPVERATVTLAFTGNDGDHERARTDAGGHFHFRHVDNPDHFTMTLNVEAVDFAPAVERIEPTSDANTPRVFHLTPGKPIRGRVVDVQGHPIAGALVKLSTYDRSRGWAWKAETGADGRFNWPDGPAVGEVDLGVSRPPYSLIFDRRVAAGDTEAVITMHQPLRLRGKVVDAETGKPIDSFILIPGWGPDQPGGTVSWRRHSGSKKAGGQYDESDLFPDQGLTRSLRVEADGYAPGEFIGFKDDAGEIIHDFPLQRASGLAGIVRGPDGKPLAGATVCLVNRTYRPVISGGKLEEFFLAPGVTMETGADGRFAFRAQGEPSGIVVVADRGFTRRSPEQLAASTDVTVEPWGRVEGTCYVGEKPLPHQKIRLSVDATTDSSTDYELENYDAETDDQGRFVVERVIPGAARASTMPTPGTSRGGHASNSSALVDVKAGETARLAIGGQGRPVVGRLVVSGGAALPIDLARGGGILSLKTGQARMPLPEGFLTWDPERRRAYSLAWYKSPEGRASRRSNRGNGVRIESDGSFRAEDVLPGTYELTLSVGTDTTLIRDRDKPVVQGTAKRDVVVPEMPGGRTDEPLDLGTVDLAVVVTHSRFLEVGEPAPGFTVKMLDGKPLSLADYRGRYVLLAFWATWCIPCLEQEPSLKAAFDAFGKDPRFALIALSLDDEIDAPRAYVARHDLGWTQGFVGEWSKTSIPADFGVRGIPSIWLIGPDGTVIGKDLRGETIQDAVAKALAKTP